MTLIVVGDPRMWLGAKLLLQRSQSAPPVAVHAAKVLAQELGRVLPRGHFEVSSNGDAISISGVGASRGSGAGSVTAWYWALPLPKAVSFRLLLKSNADFVQDFVSTTMGEPWPAPGARAHVRRKRGVFYVWWGGDSYADGLARFRPLTLDELE